jgi:hypothetical protein
MKYKNLSLLVGMLLILSFVTTGTSLLDDPTTVQKIPGHLVYPYPPDQSSVTISEIVHRIPQPITTTSTEVIAMINAHTESMYLGYLQGLVNFGPRLTDTTACWDAGDWIYDEFQNMGLQVRYQNWSYWGDSGSNIEATIPGTDPGSDEIYIVCGHYDSVSGSPGADDDGSGTIAAMAAAYVMKDYSFNHTIRFVAFSGEEQGLLGSHEYVAEAVSQGDNIVGVLNADMIGFALTQSQGSQLHVFNDGPSGWLYDFTNSVSQQYNDLIDLIALDSGYTWGSDHNSFWDAGYNALFYHEYEFNHYYHSADDTIANMNMSYAVKSSKLVLATLAELAGAQTSGEPPEPPTVNGPTEGIMGVSVNFTVTTTDPEGDEVFYFVNWDDGTTSDWIGPYNSGETVDIGHTYNDADIYEIRVRSRDVHYGQSAWSDPHTINIIQGPILDIDFMQGGILRVKTTIQNNGEVAANDVDWSIAINGGFLLLNGGATGIIDTIPAGSSQEIQSGLIFGLGQAIIQVHATTPEGIADQYQQGAQILLFFITINT